ncbi:Membrane associated serine protease, rhomboid family [Rhizobium sp. RU35A]|uniref:Rhomboid family intramembrane serine protease n=1 Tax=Rhizobium straminoryzae TaxID=1387186 RepID=A0A549SZU7_9HYPH|nr:MULTISPECIES: rhomboid family intramembrane serine protease [Rhizobium]TRL35154.1 rhomboid family intramembrane serine protease [Rhizobium straminoryzae]SIQ64772.1 Membrane associated serine protease, rhomboid family [Rhizobium sp. RU35A]
MFIPLYDVNRLKRIRLQYVTIALMAINIAIWLLLSRLPAGIGDVIVITGGFIPAVLFEHALLPPTLDFLPKEASIVTYAFLHLDVWHLGSNLLFLWVFGDNVEDALGHGRFALFYLLCAAAGALFHGFVHPLSEGPLIGASGAISGVVAAYLLLHPRVRLWTLVFFRIPLPLPAFVPLLLWIGQQVAMLLVDRQGMVSWGAHVGGILAGLVLVVILRQPGVPLLDREIVAPRALERRDD